MCLKSVRILSLLLLLQFSAAAVEQIDFGKVVFLDHECDVIDIRERKTNWFKSDFLIRFNGSTWETDDDESGVRRDGIGGYYRCHIGNVYNWKTYYTEIALVPKFEPLKMTSSFVDECGVHFKIGSNIELKCESFGYPEPTILWQIEENKIVNDMKYQFSDEVTAYGTKISYLNIMDVQETDLGVYRCKAFANKLTMSASASLSIRLELGDTDSNQCARRYLFLSDDVRYTAFRLARMFSGYYFFTYVLQILGSF